MRPVPEETSESIRHLNFRLNEALAIGLKKVHVTSYLEKGDSGVSKECKDFADSIQTTYSDFGFKMERIVSGKVVNVYLTWEIN